MVTRPCNRVNTLSVITQPDPSRQFVSLCQVFKQDNSSREDSSDNAPRTYAEGTPEHDNGNWSSDFDKKPCITIHLTADS